MSLTLEQWEFIVGDARDSVSIYAELAETSVGQSRREMLASAELCRETIAIVTRALHHPTTSP